MTQKHTLDRLLKFALHEAKYEQDLFSNFDYATLERVLESYADLLKEAQRSRTFFATLFEVMDINEDTTSLGIEHPTKGVFHVSITDIFADLDAAIAKATVQS